MNNSSEVLAAVRRARRVYLIGNGGSYANAVHVCNDLLSVGVRAYVLDPATLTAIGNDHGYEKVFARWLSVVGEAGDLVIALSGSGQSPNVLRAVERAREIGMEAIVVTDHLRTMDMQRSEERQVEIGHEVMKALRP
jgi:D-sedoheptulose 7-phosphate isomerase